MTNACLTGLSCHQFGRMIMGSHRDMHHLTLPLETCESFEKLSENLCHVLANVGTEFNICLN